MLCWYEKTPSLIRGVGINDADYRTTITHVVEGKQKAKWRCPFYLVWNNMLTRCYSEKYIDRNPSYADCYVCDEWLIFSKFREWAIYQDYHGKVLDKDILIPGNKKYSPEACVFVDHYINSFVLDCSASRGGLPLGVYKRGNSLVATCCNPFNSKQEYLGSFRDANEAHLAWKRKKREHAVKYASMQKDERVSAALLKMYI